MTTVRERGAAWVARHYWGVDHFRLTQDDFAVWAKSLLVCANGDGQLTQGERDWVLGLGAAWGWSEELLDELATYAADEPIEEVIKGSDAAFRYGGVAVLFCALDACAADGALSDGELATIRRTAARLGIDEATVEAVIRVHDDEARIIRERIALTYPPSAGFLAG